MRVAVKINTFVSKRLAKAANTVKGSVVVECPRYWSGYLMIGCLSVGMDLSNFSLLANFCFQECSPPPRYSTFVWIGSGLSYADLVWIRSKPWKEFDINNPPSFLQTVIKTNDDRPDVYLEPKE